MVSRPGRSWWRRNRLALAVLPLVLALTLAATASRLVTFWWHADLRQATTGQLGEPVPFRAGMDGSFDDQGDPVRDLTVTVEAVEADRTRFNARQGRTEVVDIPPGAELWRVDVRFQLDAALDMLGCTAALVDTQDRQADYSQLLTTDHRLPFAPCLPEDPETGLPVEPLPEDYTVAIYVVTAGDAVPAKVRIWWGPPRYVEVSLPVEESEPGE